MIRRLDESSCWDLPTVRVVSIEEPRSLLGTIYHLVSLILVAADADHVPLELGRGRWTLRRASPCVAGSIYASRSRNIPRVEADLALY